MIIESQANLGNHNEEILPMNSEEFPYACMYAEMDHYIGKSIPWHWHSAFEIDYVEEGEMEFRTVNEIIRLQQGSAIFINSNILHDVHVKEGMRGCRIYAHFFNMHFLSGMYNSIFEHHYIIPVLKCKELPAYAIRPDSPRKIRMIDQLLQSIKLCEREDFGYEFEIRANLSRFWYMMIEETSEILKQNSSSRNTDSNRLKMMMKFVHENYSEKLTLLDIAQSANISPRECTRCFQRSIGFSPINYLNDYRIRMAAKMLLQTDHNIIAIGENCGFSSSSYFGKVYRETFGCTPKEYRKLKLQTFSSHGLNH